MSHDPAIQLRLDYSGPASPVTAGISLSGLTVIVTVYHGSAHDAVSLLVDAGISASAEQRGIVFPLAQLARLAKVSDLLVLEPAPELELALQLARSVADSGLPVAISMEAGALRCSFLSQGKLVSAPLREQAAMALLLAEIPFTATSAAYDKLSGTNGFPLVLGRAALNHEGFIEINSGNPHSLESSPLPGLFRIAEARYGLSCAHRDQLLALRGVEAFDLGTMEEPDLAPWPVSLTSELESSAREIARRLVNFRGAVVCYRSGHGRRTASLAALAGMEAWPALIVCPPHSIWMWTRQLDMFGVSSSLRSPDADVHLVTYLDLDLGARLGSYATLVFDDLTGEAMSALGALERLRLYSDAYRLGIASSWVDDPELSCALLNAVRPGEFDLAGMPLSWRYPGQSVVRAEEHARCYLLSRSHPPTQTSFRQSQTIVVPPGELEVDYDRLLSRLDNGELSARDALAEARALSAFGSTSTLSPKIAATVSLVRENAAAGSIAVLTSSHTAALALRAALLPTRAVISNRAVVGPEPLLIHVGYDLPDLTGFDLVVVLDYPLSTLDIDEAAGPAWSDHGAASTIVLHSPGLVDDRLSVFAALNRERGIPLADVVVDDEAYDRLLSKRWQR